MWGSLNEGALIMRWVFIRPRNKSCYYDPEIQEPLGLEYLSASRRARGDQVLILDSILESLNDTKLARRAAAYMPDVIGFSITTAQELDSVKNIYAECLLSISGRSVLWLAGGNFVTTESVHARKFLPPEFMLVKFEGEIAIERLKNLCGSRLESGEGGMDPLPLDGIFSGTSVEDLDTLPFPDRPFAKQILSRGGAFSLQGSRGCCGACRYCSSPGMRSSTNGRWRGRSPANIVEEISFLNQRFNAAAFNFIDEDFLGYNHLTDKRAREFTTELRRRNLKITFGIQVRPDSLNEEIVDLLVEAGLIYVFMGIESDEPKDFMRWGRPWTSDPWRLVSRLQRNGVAVNAGALLFHSHSTFQSIQRFSRMLYKHGLLEYRSATNRLDAMPGSVLYKRGLEAKELHPDITGPQALPHIHPEIEEFRRNLLIALEPLGPPSMQALCSLPPVLARKRMNNSAASDYLELQRIISFLDETVALTFFTVLDQHEKRKVPRDLVAELRLKNLDHAITGARDLVAHKFAASFDALREAIRIDSGL
jgi:hypothetical protein